MSIEKDLAFLSNDCFRIETQLPLFDCFSNDNSDAQELRRQLYNVRIELGRLQGHAKRIEEDGKLS
jgi:hypothetical protein